MSADASTTGPDESWAAAASSALYSSIAAATSANVGGTITSSPATGSLASPAATATSTAIPPNPLAALQPPYSRSLVVQIIVLSCVATLHVVLLLHLLFTTRYHLPLARVNYILLTSGCISSFAAILWQVIQVAYDARARAKQWPFMYDYLEYLYPEQTWPLARKAVWLVLNAVVVLLCHVGPNFSAFGRTTGETRAVTVTDTLGRPSLAFFLCGPTSQAAHIHVLTLLYPSNLEKRLILALLLPLALISCALSFSALLQSQREQDIFDAGSAICNSTLTLLYTCALLFWGLYIARPRAWGKMDDSGSTAVFGGCAIGMAILGTALSFFGVQRGAEAFAGNEGWLSKVTWCVLLWQTWFSVWWWIGAGMYGAERPIDEDEELNERYSSSHTIFGHEGSIRRFVDENIPGLRRRKGKRRKVGSASQAGAGHEEDEGDGGRVVGGEAIEMDALTSHGGNVNDSDVDRHRHRRSTTTDPPRNDPFPRVETSSATSTTATMTPPTLLSQLMRKFRKAHTRALRQAQRDLKREAEENSGLNEAIHGKRGNGWSVSGILKARQKAVAGSVAAKGRRPGGGGGGGATMAGALREGPSTRDDRRVGAVRLDDDYDEEEAEGRGGRDAAGRNGRSSRSSRQPQRRQRDEGWEDLAAEVGRDATDERDTNNAGHVYYPPRHRQQGTQFTPSSSSPPSQPHQQATSSAPSPTDQRRLHLPRTDRARESQQVASSSSSPLPLQPVTSKRFQNWRRKDVTRYD